MKARIIAAAAVLAAAMGGGTVAAATAANGSMAPKAPPVTFHHVDLHQTYSKALPRATHGPIEYKTQPYHKNSSKPKSNPAGSCTEPNCNLNYNGGSVEHNPQVYLLLWGPNWNSSAADAQYLAHLYEGLGGNGDTWSAITTQYGDSTGHPAFSAGVLKGAFQDTSTPAGGGSVTDANLTAEADALLQQQAITPSADIQVIVAAQSGTCFAADSAGVFAGNCGTPDASGNYCAWHAASGKGETFTNLPYTPNAGTYCGENWINGGSAGTFDGFSTVGAHEFAETVTDPFPNSGWWDGADPYGGEIADKCAWGGANWGGGDPSGDVTLSTGTFAMQSLWSNAAGACVMSNQALPPPTYAGQVTNAYSHLCLNDSGWSKSNGAPVVQWGCGYGNEQYTFNQTSTDQWGNPVGQLVSNYSKLCLNDAGYAGPGGKVIQWACGSYSNELWTYWPTYHEYSLYTGSPQQVCLNDPGWSKANGTQQIVWSCPDTANEQYSLPSLPNPDEAAAEGSGHRFLLTSEDREVAVPPPQLPLAEAKTAPHLVYAGEEPSCWSVGEPRYGIEP